MDFLMWLVHLGTCWYMLVPSGVIKHGPELAMEVCKWITNGVKMWVVRKIGDTMGYP